MTTLKIDNDYSYLFTDQDALRNILWKSMRWHQRNYWATSLYKQRIWDGYVDFFSKKNGKFLTGLLPEVKAAIRELGYEYNVIDERKQVQFTHESIDEQFLNQYLPASGFWPDGKPAKPITLEDYQVELVNQALTHHRGIVKAPTSAGKTFILIAIIKCLRAGTPVLILGNRKGVVHQNYKELIKWGVPNVGIYDGETHEPNLITCAMVQSIEHMERLLPKFRVLIVDEVHMMMNATAIACYKKLKACSVRIAISATPFKFENKKNKTTGDPVHKYNVKGYFGPLFTTEADPSGTLQTKTLQDRGRLSKSRCTFYPIDEPQIPYDIYIDAVTNGIAKSWHFHDVVSRLAKKLKGRTLILVERIAHGDALQNLIPGSIWVRGQDTIKTREWVVKQLQDSKDDVVAIATQGIFNAAINVFVHNLVNAAGGKAEHDIIQRMGRGLRTADDKEILNYYDFIFRINQYLESHSNKRLKILEHEGHEIIVKEGIDF